MATCEKQSISISKLFLGHSHSDHNIIRDDTLTAPLYFLVVAYGCGVQRKDSKRAVVEI